MGNVYLISRDLDRVVLFQIAVENKFTALQVEYFLDRGYHERKSRDQ